MSSDRVTVVGAVILEGGRVLAARRVRPADLAGFWEFPGGKVEAGEEPQVALVREILEELDVDIAVGDEILGENGPWPISEKYGLRLFRTIVAGGVPKPVSDHDELRWLDPSELDVVDWLPSDRAALDAVRRAVQDT
ncbi:MAG: (deoxy)nucleoside triphosphate pyrophosphohydrolase [Nocardioidaceae bacterium]|nr:MAG: (deoxy)nucleoside triphosphate pyrophosphohydrolase [Nocardioidaceae bacterium]